MFLKKGGYQEARGMKTERRSDTPFCTMCCYPVTWNLSIKKFLGSGRIKIMNNGKKFDILQTDPTFLQEGQLQRLIKKL